MEDHWAYPYSTSLRPTFHLCQVGTVATGATQLLYSYTNPPFPGLPDRFIKPYINGILQPLSGVLDVSAFAGQKVSLEFVFPGGINHYYSFDIYGFVPGPSVWALFGLRRETTTALKWITAGVPLGTWRHLNRRLRDCRQTREGRHGAIVRNRPCFACYRSQIGLA